MGAVVTDLSMSLDGFIAGPDDGPHNALGDGGQQLFAWMMAGDSPRRGDRRFRPTERSRPAIEDMFAVGTLITGRRTFDTARGWRGDHPLGVPFVLLTHNPPQR